MNFDANGPNLESNKLSFSKAEGVLGFFVFNKEGPYVNNKNIIHYLKNYKNETDSEYKRVATILNNLLQFGEIEHHKLLLLSEKSAQRLFYGNINNLLYVCIDGKIKELVSCASVNYNSNFTYCILSYGDQANLFDGDDLKLNNLHNDINISPLIYKYQDPVVRMVCEYLIMLNDEFIISGKLQADKINEYYGYLMEEKQMKINGHDEDYIQENGKFWNWIRNYFIGKTGKIADEKSVLGNIEGTYCPFGYGKYNCCGEVLRKSKINSLYLKLDKFDLVRAEYNEMKRNVDYYNWKNLSENYDTIYNNPSHFIENDIDKKFVSICQEVINIIIASSGRAEGKAPSTKGAEVTSLPDGVEPRPYDPISIIEVLDKTNDIWITRSERFHLSRSPCVHFGLKNYDITDKLVNFYGLPMNDYRSNVLLHSFGHALDRLYCGHAHNNNKYKQTNQTVFDEIIDLFKIILKRIHFMTQAEINLSPLKYVNINNMTISTLYYLSINDIPSLLTLPKNGKTVKVFDIFNYADVFNYLKTIDDKITTVTHVHMFKFLKIMFNFYNINYPYKNIDGKMIMTDECSTIKKMYGCTNLDSKIKYVINE